MKKIFTLLASVLLAANAYADMCKQVTRAYGVQTTIGFHLPEIDGVDAKVDAAHASGDTVIMKDEGTPTNTTNGFTDEGSSYAIVLTATEMSASRIVVDIFDQGTKAWLDSCIEIETYGTSGQHALNVNVTTIEGTDATDVVDARLAAYDGPTNAEMEARTLVSANYATASALATTDSVADAIKVTTDQLADTLEDSGGGNYIFTEASLANAPAGGGGGADFDTLCSTLTTVGSIGEASCTGVRRR